MGGGMVSGEPALRLALVGVNHGRSYRAVVEQSHLAQVVVLVDLDESRLRQTAALFSVPLEHCFTSLSALFNNGPMVQGVIVATPGTIRQPVLEALAAGKHVFCENPLATTLPVAEEIVQAAAQRPELVVTVNEQWRFLPGVLRLKQRFDGGAIGSLRDVFIGGKGREPDLEMARIGSHLLSVVIHHFTGSFARCYPEDSVIPARPTWQTASGLQIHGDFEPRGYDVRRCYVELAGSNGFSKASGGFLERVAERGRVTQTDWQHLPVPGTWFIEPGMEDQALADSAMNPTFSLFEQWIFAFFSGEKNPYPPADFLPVAAAMDMFYRSRS